MLSLSVDVSCRLELLWRRIFSFFFVIFVRVIRLLRRNRRILSRVVSFVNKWM